MFAVVLGNLLQIWLLVWNQKILASSCGNRNRRCVVVFSEGYFIPRENNIRNGVKRRRTEKRNIMYRAVFFPFAGMTHQVGRPNSSPPRSVSSRPSGNGVVPNSIPRACVLPFHGLWNRAQFSSHIAIHGKSSPRKQTQLPMNRQPKFHPSFRVELDSGDEASLSPVKGCLRSTVAPSAPRLGACAIGICY